MADRSVSVFLKANVSDYQRGMLAASAATKAFTKDLNTSTDRATNLTQSILAIGPALVPIGSAGIPVIAGLTNQLAFAAAGAGVTALALAGVGDALKASNEYAIEPTLANYEKLQLTLDKLGTAGAGFVAFLQEIRPELQGLQDMAQAGLFPGAEDGIRELMQLLPQAERIVGNTASAIGDLIAEGGENLNSDRWAEFFTFLETEARPTLIDTGRTLGNLAEGFANLWMAFDPMSDQFSSSFLRMSRDFAEWTDGLDETQDFQEFLDYVATNGPKAWETLGAVGNGLLEIVEAAAPVGALALPVIESVADTIAIVADSDLGPVIIGVVSLTSAYSRLIAVSQAANSSAIGGLFSKSAYGGTFGAAKDLPAAARNYRSYDIAAARAKMSADDFAAANGRVGASAKATAKLVGGAGGLAFVMSDLDDKMGLTNTSMLALAGSMAGPWGAAIGGGIGLVMDFAAAGDDAAESIRLLQQAAATPGLTGAQRHDISVTAMAHAEKGGGDQKLWDEVDKVNAVLDANAEASMEAAFAEAGMANAMRNASDETRRQTFELLNNINAKNESRNAALVAANAELAYEAAIDRAHAAAKQNGRTLDKTTEAGRANRAALNELAGAWNNLDPATQNAAGAQRRARAEFVEVARQMGATKAQAQALADKYMEIPQKVSTTVRVRDEATGKLKAIQQYIDGMHGKTIKVAVAGGTPGGITYHATGGPIFGPGSGTSDDVLFMGSNGEHAAGDDRRTARGDQRREPLPKARKEVGLWPRKKGAWVLTVRQSHRASGRSCASTPTPATARPPRP